MARLEERESISIAIIPARYESTRLPGKPLLDINGKSMIRTVWENISQSKILREVYIATDDERVLNHCQSFGANVIMTPKNLPSGTDRIAYVVRKLDLLDDIIINVQGDEPLVQAKLIDDLLINFATSLCEVGTIIQKINSFEELENPNCVKVTIKNDYTALYFSRQAIPYIRDYPKQQWLSKQTFWKHIGIYAYRSHALERFTKLPQTDLETSECLEQLRLLQNDDKYYCFPTKDELIGVDTPEDLEKVRAILK